MKTTDTITDLRHTSTGPVARINGVWHSVNTYQGQVDEIRFALPAHVIAELGLPEDVAVTKYDTLAEAVAAAGIDLSYNPALAAKDIATVDADPEFAYALVTANDRVWVAFKFRNKTVGNTLTEYTPFYGGLTNSDLRLVEFHGGDTLTFHTRHKHTRAEYAKLAELTRKTYRDGAEFFIA